MLTQISPSLAGLPPTIGHHGPEPDSVDGRSTTGERSMAQRIADCRRVWSRAYGRVVSDEESIEILRNVRRLAEVLLKTKDMHPL